MTDRKCWTSAAAWGMAHCLGLSITFNFFVLFSQEVIFHLNIQKTMKRVNNQSVVANLACWSIPMFLKMVSCILNSQATYYACKYITVLCPRVVASQEVRQNVACEKLLFSTFGSKCLLEVCINKSAYSRNVCAHSY